MNRLPFTKYASKALNEGREIAGYLGFKDVSSIFVLLGLYGADGSLASEVLKMHGVTRELIEEAIKEKSKMPKDRRRTVQDLFRFGLLYTSDKELIKDCIHDVFVKIHMNRAKLAPTDNIAAYLTVALKNTLFNALKKTTDSFPFDEIGEREETVDESPSTPETIYINNEQEKQVQATVHTMMSVLTDRQREIIYYRYIKEMSIDEISKVTDMNNQSVSNSIQRALGRIRDLFKRK